MNGNMRPLDAVLPAGEWVTLPGPGDKIFPAVLVGDLELEFYDDSGTRFGAAIMAVGDGGGPGPAFRFVRVKSAIAQTVRLIVTMGEFSVSRIAGQVEVAGVVETAPDYSRTKDGDNFVFTATAAAVAGEYSCVYLDNPSASGKNLIVPALTLMGSGAATVYLKMGAEQGTGAAMTDKNLLSGGRSPVAKWGSGSQATPFSGGLFGLKTAGEWLDLNLPGPLVVTPGNGLFLYSASVNIEVGLWSPHFEEDV